ncbi:MAG: hypothetical protein ACI9US_002257, partial [Gammaproteobacteria bacterium]
QRKVRKKTAAPMIGASVSKRLGRGLDFAEVREYQPGDDVRMIDWKVTARSGRAHTKMFVEERERPVLLVVDFRASMRFGTRGMFKSALAARLAALLGWCAVSGQDRVGGFVFSDDTHSEIRPQAGRRGLMALFRAIQQTQLHQSSVGGEQLGDTLSRLRQGVHGGSTVVILSDFSGFDERSRSALGSVLQSLDVVAVQVCDPLDATLPPPGEYAFRNNNDREGSSLLMKVRSKRQQTDYRDQFEKRQQDLKTLFASNRHYFTTALTSDSLIDTTQRIVLRQSQRSE